jgi:hypothetical protein
MADAALNFNEILDDIAKPVAKKKKGKKEKAIVTSAPDSVKVAIDNIIEAKAREKKAKSDRVANEAPVIEFFNTHRDNQALSSNFNKSFKIQGTSDDKVVNVVSANKWSFDEADIEEIAEILGEDLDDLMPPTYDIKVKPEIFDSEEMQEELMEMIGERFSEFFEVNKNRKPVEDFDKKIFKYGKQGVEDLRVFMKQSKPSVR